jgi:hypothetical protein
MSKAAAVVRSVAQGYGFETGEITVNRPSATVSPATMGRVLAGSAFRPRFVSDRLSRRRPVRTRDGVARSTSSTPVWGRLPLVSIGEVVTRFTLCVVGGIEMVPAGGQV